MAKRTKFTELKKVFKTLRGPKGCPWDKKQTHQTLLKYLKEESNEFIDATRRKNYEHMKEELGDILMQVMLHSQLASEDGLFDIEDVMDGLIKKMKRRHPHVFGKEKVKSIEEIITNWHKIKALEKKGKK
ncbi:MAG: MazG nucleotide pyrophosphohydrolase domain-containing protein [Candidatus Omnitrophota bacterium]